MKKKATFHPIPNIEVLENEGVYFDDHKDGIKAEVKYVYNNQKNIHAKDLVKTLTKKQREIDIVYEQPQRLKQYKVDEELSLEEKLEAGWEKEKIKLVLNKQAIEITMLKKELPGKAKHAYVREFLDGVPEEYIGTQLFTRTAVENIPGLEAKLPTQAKLQMLRGEDHEGFLKKNNIVLSGEHIALSPIVANFGKRCGVWTAEGSVLIDNKDIFKASEPVEYGISVLVMDE